MKHVLECFIAFTKCILHGSPWLAQSYVISIYGRGAEVQPAPYQKKGILDLHAEHAQESLPGCQDTGKGGGSNMPEAVFCCGENTLIPKSALNDRSFWFGMHSDCIFDELGQSLLYLSFFHLIKIVFYSACCVGARTSRRKSFIQSLFFKCQEWLPRLMYSAPFFSPFAFFIYICMKGLSGTVQAVMFYLRLSWRLSFFKANFLPWCSLQIILCIFNDL